KRIWLVPPVKIKELSWNMGCPQVLEGRELKDAGTLNVHCFLNHLNEIFHDEYGAISKGPS
ncbi:hypothetical protein N8677_02635, partial [Verrucomicrobia bacterium]|nr:hypothetical protein [Verrucomicrobiota bacterium]